MGLWGREGPEVRPAAPSLHSGPPTRRGFLQGLSLETKTLWLPTAPHIQRTALPAPWAPVATRRCRRHLPTRHLRRHPPPPCCAGSVAMVLSQNISVSLSIISLVGESQPYSSVGREGD